MSDESPRANGTILALIEQFLASPAGQAMLQALQAALLGHVTNAIRSAASKLDAVLNGQ